MKRVYEVSVPLNKSKIKRIFGVGAVLFLISVGCVLWGHFNWDEYSTTVNSLKRGTVERGWAPVLYGWGMGFAIVIVFVYGIFYSTLDFKNPVFAVNKDGIMINKEFFKLNFITWSQIQKIETSDSGELNIWFKNPEEIVNRQKGIGKAFLKQSYVKEPGSFSINPEDSAENKEACDLIKKYFLSK